MNLNHFDFIELAYEYPLYLPLPEKEDYFLLPVSVAEEMGLKAAIFTNRTSLTPQRKAVVHGVEVFRFDSIPSMLKQVFRMRPFLVHGHGFGWIPATVAPALTENYAFTPHTYKLYAYSKWKVDIALKFIKKAEAIIALTEFEATQFRYAIGGWKVKVIPHPIDSTFFSPKEKNEHVKHLEDVTSAKKIILCVSNLFPIKNLETLLRAFAIVHRQIKGAKLLIVGGEPKTKIGVLTAKRANWKYQLRLLDLISSLGIAGDVTFSGYKGEKDLRDLYRIADVFCLTSTRECQSLATGEAASSEVPLALSDLEPLREIYHDCALFQKPFDYEQLSNNIITILEDSKLARTLGRNGRVRMLEYHPTKIRKKMKALYEMLGTST
jgi:glycosyltransferase involved in cell wall biosynthesis